MSNKSDSKSSTDNNKKSHEKFRDNNEYIDGNKIQKQELEGHQSKIVGQEILREIKHQQKLTKDTAEEKKNNWDKLALHYTKLQKKATKQGKRSLSLFYMTRRGECYLRNKDYFEFIRLYPNIIKICNQLNLEKLPQKSDDTDDVYIDWFSSMLIREVSEKTKIIYGNDPKLIKGFVDAINYAQDNEPCLIIGETGTGKEIVANLMHNISIRKNNRFSAFNCAGCTESHFNSEMHGVISGAFTGVNISRLGACLNACGKINDEDNKGYYINKKNRIEFQCNGKAKKDPSPEDLAHLSGTLFLDEINSLPFYLQPRLLRIIQEKEVTPLGEDKKRKYAAKIICACNIQFTGNEEIDDFRQDLYHRISCGVLFLPALREMRDSIPDIAKQIINDTTEKLGYNKIKVRASVADKMKNYHWPGNHRELANVIYRALKKIVLEERTELKYEDVDINVASTENRYDFSVFDGKDYYQVSKMFVNHLLEKTNGNKTEAANLGGFRDSKQIHQILNPKKYHLKRFLNCNSYPDVTKK